MRFASTTQFRCGVHGGCREGAAACASLNNGWSVETFGCGSSGIVEIGAR